MIKIKSTTVQNFLSIGNFPQTIHFNNGGLTLVLGRNLDIGGENSRNGVGKTSILQALFYGLYGEPLSDIKIDNLINDLNKKNMQVTLVFERDGKEYRIERGRKPNYLRFFVDGAAGVTDDALGENKHTQTEITRLIGMSHELFQHIVGMNTQTIPFLKMKPAQQRPIIEELLGIATVSIRDARLSDLIKITKDKLKSEEVFIKACGEANDRIELAIGRTESLLKDWTHQQQLKINSIIADVDSLSGIDFEQEALAFDVLDDWTNSERKLRDSADQKQRSLTAILKEIAAVETTMQRLQSDIDNSDDTQIVRLNAEVLRCDADALKDVGQQIAKIEIEIARCNQEASAGCEDQVSRLIKEAERAENDAIAKDAVATQKKSELIDIQHQIDHSDGHSCQTCGQGIEGTGHLEKIIETLEAKARIAQKEIDRAHVEAENLRKGFANIEAEINAVKIAHGTKQGEWIRKAIALGAEIEDEKQQCLIRQSEWRHKAAVVRQDIVLAEQAAKDRLHDRLAKFEEADREKQDLLIVSSEIKLIIQEIIDAIMVLGVRPLVSFENREEVWKLRETRDALARDLEREQLLANPHQITVDSLRSTLTKIDVSNRELLKNESAHQDFLHKLLSSNGSFIRKKIIDTNLLFLNGRLDHYLKALGLPHTVLFMPDLGIEINLMGHDYDFPQLSRGEQCRVLLAIPWAFRDVWERLNTTINLLFVDENADNGLDESGAEASLGILTNMAGDRSKSVFLISHKETLMTRANRILMVEKENRFTRFEMDAEI